MDYAKASFENVTFGISYTNCFPCNPCGPDQVRRDGSQCFPCNPCGPDQLRTGGSQCFPCNPCGPDQRRSDGSQCFPCNPCGPDQRRSGGSQCFPCNPCGPDWESPSHSGGGGSSGGCFITGACVNAMRLPDDCDELQTLRALRDKRVLYDPAFAGVVKEYYRIAPAVVAAIDASPDKHRLYSEIYSDMVRPAVDLVKANKEDEAVDLYTRHVLRLKAEYPV